MRLKKSPPKKGFNFFKMFLSKIIFSTTKTESSLDFLFFKVELLVVVSLVFLLLDKLLER